MSRPGTNILLALATVFITILLYQPASLLIYKIREPYFGYPIKTDRKNLIIRNDKRGSGEFGAKRRNGRSHNGIDILAPVGTPAHASKSGVAFCLNVPNGYGKYVMIYHPDGYQTLYAHLSGWNVVSAKAVRRGDVVGFVGRTGNASHSSIEPHLHFEIQRYGVIQDPRRLMR